MHHVAQCAGVFIKGAAAFHTQVFGNADLDIGNVFTPPQRFKQGVAKAQCKQVLYRRLAEVVINAKYLALFKEAAHRVVDAAVGRQIMAQRFFQHDAGLRCVQSGAGKLLADGGEQGRGGGNIHDHRVGIALLQGLRQGGIVVRLGQVHADKFEQCGKACKLFGAGPLRQFHLVKARLDQAAVLFVREVVAADADNAAAFGQAAVAKCLKQGRHEFAPGQVACAAKEYEIKTHGLKLHK